MRLFVLCLLLLLCPMTMAQSDEVNLEARTVCEFVADKAALANTQNYQRQQNSPFRQDYTIQGGYFDIDGDGTAEQFGAEIGGNHAGPGYVYGLINDERGSGAGRQGEELEPEEKALYRALEDLYTRWLGRGFAWLPFANRVYGIHSPGFGLWQPRTIHDGGATVCVLETHIELRPYPLYGHDLEKIAAEQGTRQVDRSALCEVVSSSNWDVVSTNEPEGILRPTDTLNEADIARLFEILERRGGVEVVAKRRSRYEETGGEGVPWLGDSVGALAHDGPNVLNIDWDNDGNLDRLTYLRIAAGSNSGCSASYWELLPDLETGDVDEEERALLLKLQNVAEDDEPVRHPICWRRNHWRVNEGRSYLESVGIRAPFEHAVDTIIDTEIAPICRAQIGVSFDIIFDRDRDIWPEDVRANAAIYLKDIEE